MHSHRTINKIHFLSVVLGELTSGLTASAAEKQSTALSYSFERLNRTPSPTWMSASTCSGDIWAAFRNRSLTSACSSLERERDKKIKEFRRKTRNYWDCNTELVWVTDDLQLFWDDLLCHEWVYQGSVWLYSTSFTREKYCISEQNEIAKLLMRWECVKIRQRWST